MADYIAVYIYDVKRAIEEVESYFVGYPMRYDIFEKDMPIHLVSFEVIAQSIKSC